MVWIYTYHKYENLGLLTYGPSIVYLWRPVEYGGDGPEEDTEAFIVEH